METTQRSIKWWVVFFSQQEIPVLRQTSRSLAQARSNIDRINGRQVSAIVLHDPLMAMRVLATIRAHHDQRLQKEITTIEQTVMMLGVEPFFRHFEQLAVIEDQLGSSPQALLGLLYVIRRAQRAAKYASDLAMWRHDLGIEEITLAALLHDLAEILMWCFAPQQAQQILAMQQADPALRSAAAQQTVLGFRFSDLQLALCRAWQLPDLHWHLLNQAHAAQPRVRNAQLAVDLARHSTNGWDNPALPDDFSAIEALLHIDHDMLLFRLGRRDSGAPQAAGGAENKSD